MTPELWDDLIRELKTIVKLEDFLRVRKSQIRKELRLTPKSLQAVLIETDAQSEERMKCVKKASKRTCSLA
jgi:hypothetical protein